MRDRIRENETPELLSARLGAPVCAILRANRLTIASWLIPGREIEIPSADLCKDDAFPCPVLLMHTKAKAKQTEVVIAGVGDTIPSLARQMGTSERLLLLARGNAGPLCEGERICIAAEYCKKRIGSVLPNETVLRFCERLKIADAEELCRLNEISGTKIWPGMRLIMP